MIDKNITARIVYIKYTKMSKLKGHKAAVGCQHFQNDRSSFVRESTIMKRVNCLLIICIPLTNFNNNK